MVWLWFGCFQKVRAIHSVIGCYSNCYPEKEEQSRVKAGVGEEAVVTQIRWAMKGA